MKIRELIHKIHGALLRILGRRKMIGKTRTNIRAEIDTQYEILSQMIEDIAVHYQEEVHDFEQKVNTIAEEDSRGDYEIKSSILKSFDEAQERYSLMLYEARKILFCSIFSYLESMLYGLASYFKIPIGKTNQVGQIIEKIVEMSTEKLALSSNKDIICDFYRPLRNKYMHGHLGSENDKRSLQYYADKDERIGTLSGYFEITDNAFLWDALNRVNTFLICIEDTYVNNNRRRIEK